MQFSNRSVTKPAAVVVFVTLAFFGYLAYDRYQFYSRNAGDGRPVCTDDLQVASKEAVLHVGVWNYLQDRFDRLAKGANPKTELRRNNPQDPIDYAAVNSFLESQPNCCEVKANWRVHDDYGIWRSLNIVQFPNIAWVRVVDTTWRSEEGYQVYGPRYRVDACWKNVRRGPAASPTTR